MKLNLIFLLGFKILGMVIALSPTGKEHFLEKNCIRMTPQKEQRLNEVVDKLTNFLNGLIFEYQEFDIGLVNVEFEHHSEEEEKETILKITVNDCAKPEEEVESDSEEKATNTNQVVNEAPNEGNASKDTASLETKSNESAQSSNNINNTAAKLSSNEDGSTVYSNLISTTNETNSEDLNDENDISVAIDKNRKKPQVIELNLPENGQELLNQWNKKKKQIKPLVVFLQEDNNNQHYIFFDN